MADIADDVECVNCTHLASAHEDGDMGENTGACTMSDCDCEQMEAPPAEGASTPPTTYEGARVEIGGDGTTTIYDAAGEVVFTTAEPVVFTSTGDGLLDVAVGMTVDPAADPATTAAVEGDTSEDADVDDDTQFQRFVMPVMVLENVDTGDGRFINPEALSWRELPIPLMAITRTTMAHDDAELVGRIESVERIDATGLINPKTGESYGADTYALRGEGSFTSFENATQVAELIREQFLRGVSVDLSDVAWITELLDEDGNPIPEDEVTEDDIIDAIFFGGNEIRDVVESARVMGATVCPFPAFEGAYIELADGTATPQEQPVGEGESRTAVRIHDRFGARKCASCGDDGQPLVASAGPMAPPAAWFDDPALDEPTPLTITEDGRVFGHLATWGVCHIGVSGRCTTAPMSKTNYGYFRTGAVECADGDLVPIGQITLGTGHAPIHMNAAAAMAHYDNTGTAVADIAVGEDAHGIWVAGAMRPDVTDLQVRQLRAAGLSGDWRGVGNSLELVGALAVNVQGFPVVRAAGYGGATTALVAAGGRGVISAIGRDRDRLRALEAWRRDMEPVLLDAQADRLARRVRGDTVHA